MVLVDFLHELVRPSTMVRGLHDSGAYQVRPVRLAGTALPRT
jgi:hypothetical protein